MMHAARHLTAKQAIAFARQNIVVFWDLFVNLHVNFQGNAYSQLDK